MVDDDSDDWRDRATRLLRSEMVRYGVTTAELANRLGENERTVSNKIGKGGFSAAWLLRCCAALGVTNLRLD